MLCWEDGKLGVVKLNFYGVYEIMDFLRDLIFIFMEKFIGEVVKVFFD